MNANNAVIIAPPPPTLEPILNQSAIELRELALSSAALIGKVENAAENEEAVKAQKSLKEFSRLIEKERVRLNEPALEYSRALMRLKEKAVLDVEKEYGRISALVAEFQLNERRRVAEEQRKQQEELDRIERERQSELKRIADELDRIEREAKEAHEKAERLANEAKTKKQREAAESARLEADRQAQAARFQAEAARDQAAKVEEKASEASYVESRPVATTRAAGQRVTIDWEVLVTNPIEFAKHHPDCVNWEKLPILLLEVKEQLSQGRTFRGLTATRKVSSGVRIGGRTIEV
jgi:hypothetical protein